jgi:hypothetical protein
MESGITGTFRKGMCHWQNIIRLRKWKCRLFRLSPHLLDKILILIRDATCKHSLKFKLYYHFLISCSFNGITRGISAPTANSEQKGVLEGSDLKNVT